jgi:hypothetical protein
MLARMRLIQSVVGVVAVSAIVGCGQSSAPSGGHEAATATATAATADLPPPTAKVEESAAIAPTAPAVVSAAPSASTAATATTTTTTTNAKGATIAPTTAPTATAIAVTPTAAPTVVATAAPAPVVEVMSPKVVEGSFNTWMQSSGRYTVGQQGTVQVVLVAKGDWHCNDKYPYKFKLGAASGGVSYPSPIVRAEGLRIAPERTVMTVPFVPSAPGDARVSGTFSFSVCSAASCQIETRELALTVKVD